MPQVSSPANGETAGPSTQILGLVTDTDGAGLNYVTVAILDLVSGEWMDATGVGSPGYQSIVATLNGTGNSADWTVDLEFPPSTSSDYLMIVTAVDGFMNFTSINSTFTISGQ